MPRYRIERERLGGRAVEEITLTHPSSDPDRVLKDGLVLFDPPLGPGQLAQAMAIRLPDAQSA